MEEKTIFKNKIIIDLRVLTECQKKIDKTRFYKLIKMLNLSISADGLHPEATEEHDKYFEPRTEAERDLWESCRKLAKKDMEELIKKHEGGKKGAEIRKQKKKEEAAVSETEKTIIHDQDLPPITPQMTKQEFFAWAEQMNECVGMGGFTNTPEQRETFWNHFEAQGFRRKNGMPIRDLKALFKIWVAKDKKNHEQEQEEEIKPRVFVIEGEGNGNSL